MAWRLPQHELRIFSRNPLIAVVVQLRFDPILKVKDRVADFQEQVRARFPKFDEETTHAFELDPALGVRTRTETELRFQTRDLSAAVVLGARAVALETRAHIDRESLLRDFALVMNAMRATYGTLSPTRLGLRYINSIDRPRIARELGREVSWSELVASDFIKLPCGLADLEGTSFGAEVTSSVATGKMTLRYGMLPEPPDHQLRFRLDLDRYDENLIDVATIGDQLAAFANDIYSVFATAAGPTLREWMEKGDSADD